MEKLRDIVLEVTIEDEKIRTMLADAQHDLVSSQIMLNKANNDFRLLPALCRERSGLRP